MLDIVHNRLGLRLLEGVREAVGLRRDSFMAVRERHPHVVFERATEALANSGFEEISLLSLSSGIFQIQTAPNRPEEHFCLGK